MSETVAAAVTALNDRLDGKGFDGVAKFVIEGKGSLLVDADGARAEDLSGETPADVTLRASVETFQRLIEGNLNPASAFMTGKLKVEGDMGAAMRLASALA